MTCKYLYLISGITLCLLLASCTKYSEYRKKSSGQVFVTPYNFQIESVRVHDWKVGKYLKQKVSKGVNIQFRLPVLSKSDLMDLVTTKKVNSWLVKVMRRGRGRSETIGWMYIPLSSSGEKNLRVNPIKMASFNVYYAAAAISNRFLKYNCPALDHRKEISIHKIVDSRSNSSKVIVVSMAEEHKVNARVEQFSYGGYVINGGMKLSGEYHLEIAFYNSIKKRVKSNFIHYDQYVDIVTEKDVHVKGCAGFKVPPKGKDDGNSFKKFKFGR
jgi:hypothetical protein